MRIGVYVGSFNPVHLGHKYVINYLIDNGYVDRIVVVPTGNYWNKTDLISVNHRINMLKYYENDKIIINDYLNDKQYSYEILDIIKKENKNDDIYLIIGADNIPKFYLWKNVYSILKNKIIVLNRNDIDIRKYIAKIDQDKFLILDNFNYLNISSTEIRKNVKENKDYLDENVYDYIIENNLYNIKAF